MKTWLHSNSNGVNVTRDKLKDLARNTVKKMDVRSWVEMLENKGVAVWSIDMKKVGWPCIRGPLLAYDDPGRRLLAEQIDEIVGGRTRWALVGAYYFFTTDEDAIKVKLTLPITDFDGDPF